MHSFVVLFNIIPSISSQYLQIQLSKKSQKGIFLQVEELSSLSSTESEILGISSSIINSSLHLSEDKWQLAVAFELIILLFKR